MREQYMGQEGRKIKNGDKVEVTFYSYIEPLCSVTGTVQGDYLYVEEGCIPLQKSQVYCTEIRIISSSGVENDKRRKTPKSTSNV